MEKLKKRSAVFLCISIAIMLISSIIVYLVQSDMGSTKIRELQLETDSGYTMSAYLYIPYGVSADNKAPAIVTSHGYLNNKEMQDANYVELSRRGFVVLAIDQPDHGDSDVTDAIVGLSVDGVYQGVLALSRMPFVDTERIGITGHSMGGMSCNLAIAADNAADEQLISAVLLNCADATYVDDTGAWTDVYGDRDAGILSAVYDEFFHAYTDESGVYHESPYFMNTPNAQSFLYFGTQPQDEQREANTIYTQDVNGTEAMRVIYRVPIIHPWSHFSGRSTAHVIDFFTEALSAPNPIDSSNQVWQWKEVFNFIGLCGFVMFIISLAISLTFTRPFENLRAHEVATPVTLSTRKDALWFWGGLTAAPVFSTLIYLGSVNLGTGMNVSQTEAMGLGLWSTFTGIFVILDMLVYYFCYGKKKGVNLSELGVTMPFKKLLLSVLLGVIVAAAAYTCVFIADYFFFSDFRLWTLAIKAFEAPILGYWPYILLFATYYIAASVANNCFNFVRLSKHEWVNLAVVSIFAAIPALIIPWIQYISYYSTDYMFWPQDAMHVLWLFPIVLILIFSTIISRYVYKATRNPYIAGMTNAIIVGLLTITNTCTTF